MLNADLSYAPHKASENGYMQNPALVNTNDKYGEMNKPYLMKDDGNTIYLPSDFSEGIRYVEYYSEKLIIVTVSGIDTSGNYGKWYRYCNGTSWTPWERNITSNNLQITKPFFGDVSFYPEYYTIYAHGVAIFNEVTKTMDLHFSIIPNKVEDVTIPTVYQVLSKEKIAELLGISSFTFNNRCSFITPCIDTEEISTNVGKTGLMTYCNDAYLTIGRFHTDDGVYGGWALNSNLMEKLNGKQLRYDIYGATYS